MPIFGDIINTNLPVLIAFYADWHFSFNEMNTALREVAIITENKAKVIKVSVDENKELSRNLQIDGLPTFVIFFRGEMVWKQSGMQNSDFLVQKLIPFMS